MSKDTIREEFEGWARAEGLSLISPITGRYYPDIHCAWMAWQASRADLVVKLPQPFEGDDFGMYDRDELLRAFEAAGIKVAP